ncbi:MAG: universal stress protein [Nitrospirae bacterium]|nr:universal stress protein [Nitrospirota bacterium]
MKKLLIAVDDTKGTKQTFQVCSSMCSCMRPDEIVLLYVEKFEGRSLMDQMLGDAELSTLKEVLAGSEYKEALDRKAKNVLDYYRNELESKGLKGVKTVIKEGNPADEILRAADEEKANMIIIGSRGNRVSHLFTGSVSREVVNRAEVPVLVAKSK